MSAAKQKGTRWETDLVRYLAPVLAPVGLVPRRVAQEGFADTGDIHGLDPFVAQAKNWRSWESAIREGLDGAQAQAARAGADYGVAFVKRARRSTASGYAVLTVGDFARVLARLRLAERILGDADPEALAAYRADLEELGLVRH